MNSCWLSSIIEEEITDTQELVVSSGKKTSASLVHIWFSKEEKKDQFNRKMQKSFKFRWKNLDENW